MSSGANQRAERAVLADGGGYVRPKDTSSVCFFSPQLFYEIKKFVIKKTNVHFVAIEKMALCCFKMEKYQTIKLQKELKMCLDSIIHFKNRKIVYLGNNEATNWSIKLNLELGEEEGDRMEFQA